MNSTKSVLITGASSGIGRSIALYLAKKHLCVFAGVRSKDDAKCLLKESQNSLTPILLDVTSPECILSSHEIIKQKLNNFPLDILINNAGVGAGGPIEFLSLEEFKKTFDVNFFGVISMIQAYIPLLKKSSCPKIINISSVQGKLAFPFLSPYCASKFSLEALSDCLRQELYPWNIQVSLIQPGMTKTPIFKKSHTFLKKFKKQTDVYNKYGFALSSFDKSLSKIPKLACDPIRVAMTILKVINAKKAKPRYRVGADSSVLQFLNWVLPSVLMDKLIRKIGIIKKWPTLN